MNYRMNLRDQCNALADALKRIADIAHRRKRMVYGQPRGPLSDIADIAEKALEDVGKA